MMCVSAMSSDQARCDSTASTLTPMSFVFRRANSSLRLAKSTELGRADRGEVGRMREQNAQLSPKYS